MRFPRIVGAILMLLMVASALIARGDAEPEAEQRLSLPETAEPAASGPIAGYSLRFAMSTEPSTAAESESAGELLIRQQLVEARYNVRIRTVVVAASQIVPRLTSSVLAGDPFADVIELDINSAIPSLVQQNLILPLDPYFDFSQPEWRKLPRELVTYDGAVYAFVVEPAATRGLWYNRDLLAAVGLPDPDALYQRGQWTWDAFTAAGRRVISSGADEPRFALAVAQDPTTAFVWSNGGRVVEEQNGRFWFALGSTAALEAIDFVGLLWSEGLILQGDAVGSFVAGQTAFLAAPADLGSELQQQMGQAIGWTYYPVGPRAGDVTVVADQLPVSVFPTGLEYPPERLASICTELAAPQLRAAIRREQLALHMPSERTLAVALEMGARVQVDRTAAFPELSRVMAQIVQAVKFGASAREAVLQHQAAAEAAVTIQ